MKIPELALDKFEPKVKHYKNAISVKLPNRRITVGTTSKGDIFIKTMIAYADPTPPIHHEHIRGKVHSVFTAYSQEAAEVIMAALAETLGFVICTAPTGDKSDEG